MTQNHTAYPNITRLALDMSHYNGGTAARNFHGVADPTADVKRLLDEVLGAEGVYHDDLAALDAWLGTLAETEFLTIADGKEQAMEALLLLAPAIDDEPDAAGNFINAIYEHCV